MRPEFWNDAEQTGSTERRDRTSVSSNAFRKVRGLAFASGAISGLESRLQPVGFPLFVSANVSRLQMKQRLSAESRILRQPGRVARQ